MKKLLFTISLLSVLVLSSGWREDFQKGKVSEKGFPEKWKTEGELPGVPATKVFVKGGVLRLEADKSSGGALQVVKNVDLTKTPVMRWRWRVLEHPKDGDGRIPEKDDQAVGVYLFLGGFIQKRSLSYHYDVLAPKGHWGETSYLLGVVKVKYTVLRNQTDRLGDWFVEERNVLEDLKKCYNEVPKEFGVGIICNSHNTKSRAVAEFDYIEFIPAATKKMHNAQ